MGRENLLADLGALLKRHRLVTLTGPGGSGKTRLAQELLDSARQEIETLFIDLTEVTTPAGIATAMVNALGLSNEGDAQHAITTWAATGARLVALDNLEQIEGAAEPIAAILGAGKELRMLATSRTPLGIRGEREVPVPPLELPLEETPIDVASSAAGQLFLRRAAAGAKVRLPLDPALASEIARLCRRLDGLPLAIELAAARTRVMSPGAILETLQAGDQGVLRSAVGTDRHRSLEKVLDWSIRLLTASESQILESAAACRDGFNLALLSVMCPEHDVLLGVESLTRHGLVAYYDDVDRSPRYRLLQTIRSGVVARLGKAIGEIRHRHARAVAAVIAGRWGPMVDGPELRRAISNLDVDAGNILEAIEFAAMADPRTAARLCLDLAGYFAVRPQVRETVLGLRPRFDDIFDTGQRVQARAEWNAASSRMLLAAQEDLKVRRPVAVSALADARASQVVYAELEGLYALASVELEELGGRLTAATESLVAVALSEPEDTSFRGQFLRAGLQVMIALSKHGRTGLGQATNQALETARRIGNPRAIAIWSGNAAFVALRSGNDAEAASLANEATNASRAIGDVETECWGLQLLAVARARQGRHDEAASALTRAIALVQTGVAPSEFTRALGASAAVCALRGDAREAAWLWGAATRPDSPGDESDYALGYREVERLRRHSDRVSWQVSERAGRAVAGSSTALDHAIVAVNGPTPTRRRTGVPRHAGLTAREVEILTLVGEGRTDPEIAAALFISPKTASVHVANVKAKLDAASRIELALRARDLGLVGEPAPSPTA